MTAQNSENIQFTIPPEQREQLLMQVHQTSIFLQFIEERTFEEQKLLFAEIDNILDNGMPMIEFLETGIKDEQAEWTDYRKIATLCIAEGMMDSVEEPYQRTEELHRNNNFNEAYITALRGIINYLLGISDKFPHEAVRCLFLLTDGDVEPHLQGITMTRLKLQSYDFRKTDEQWTEVEELIKGCLI